MKFKKSKRRASKSVNAGSTADIAFLLLIFFLVTTTISIDTGISVRLPPWAPTPPSEIPARNNLVVKINTNDELYVENGRLSPDKLRQTTKDFILNPTEMPSRPSNPKKAVVSLLHDRGTSYSAYLKVYNEIMGAYNELWETAAQQEYGYAYSDLSPHQQREIRKSIPLVISEGEPVEF